MTDEEKIEQAALEYERDNSYHYGYGPMFAFTDGIHWRDENPSEKALALVEKLRLIRTIMLKPIGPVQEMNVFVIAELAIAAWEKK